MYANKLGRDSLWQPQSDVTFVNKSKMDSASDAENNSVVVRDIHDFSEDEKRKILEGKDKENTQKATVVAVKLFNQYLSAKKMPNIDALPLDDLPKTFENFYVSVKQIKGRNYLMQILKCLRAGLNRFYRKNKGIDIARDTPFVKANEMFSGVLAASKKVGKGVTKSTVTISEPDLERIAEYFSHDHMNFPDPKRLQQQVIFNIIFFFCRHGRENLYNMQQNTFEIHTEPDGTQFIHQKIDEIDKNQCF